MRQEEIVAKVKEYVVKSLLHGEGEGLDENTPLLEWGIINSLAMVELISFLEEQFSVRVPDSEIKPANFESLQKIAAMVTSLAKK
jgi:acyl carrier protein